MEKEKITRPRRSGINSLRENLGRWQSLVSNLRSRLPQMPHLGDNLGVFEQIVGRIQASLSEQDVLASRSGDLVRGREADVLLARELRNRLAGQLRGQFGTDSDQLREFGVKPRRRKTRRASEEEPEVPAPPVTSQVEE